MTERLEAPTSDLVTVDLPQRLDVRLQEEIAAAMRLLDAAPAFVLASASPRRRELLGALGLAFDIHAADIPEVPQPDETPREFVARAAREKAAFVASQRPGQLILAADTVVALGTTILGKPQDDDEARRMLQALAGATHRVLTAVALIGGDAEVVVETAVTFAPIADTAIQAYIDCGEPFDKAGAYAIQGGAGRFVTSVSGSYSNVIGLPLVETAALLMRAGSRV